MSALGWCAVCRISLYLKQPSEPHPTICCDCLEAMVGQFVVCPKCIITAMAVDSQCHRERLLNRIVERTFLVLDKKLLSQPEVKFPVCSHRVKIPNLLREQTALVTFA